MKGDRQNTHRLQRLLLNSNAAKFVAVKRVARENRGRRTGGVDHIRSLSTAQCMKLAESLDLTPTKAPVRRVWIPKPGKLENRPLGIPTMRDRAQQMLVKLALEPEWETRFEKNSYGFRPGRNCADAIVATWNAINKCAEGKYVLDADIRGCFDNISHGALLQKLDSIRPIQQLIKRWLKAGILDGFNLQYATSGPPQGGVISPLLANIALHGLETHITEKIALTGNSPKPILIRYADDFVITHKDRTVIDRCRMAAEEFLRGIGLELNETKTSVRHTLHDADGKPGFDFLGFRFRSFRVSIHQKPKGRTNFKTLVAPSNDSIKKIYRRLCDIIDQSRAAAQSELIVRLNPVIRGWANYFRFGSSAQTFSKLDHLLYRKLQRWCHRRHTRKGKRWIVERYWNNGHPWKFRDPDSGRTLIKFADIHIKRHVKVRGNSHVYDRDREYWKSRGRDRPSGTLSGVPAKCLITPAEANIRDEPAPDLWQ